MKIKIFISSVQKEFKEERLALREYLRADPLLRRFFEPFLFEDIAAADRQADKLYLNEVRQCDIYLGLFGNEYGKEDKEGFSSTHREFDEATKNGKYRLIFIKGFIDNIRHPKMQKLVSLANAQLVRRRFSAIAELITGVYAALIDYLGSQELLRDEPFDAALCRDATPDDLSEEKVRWFLQLARQSRGFPLPEDSRMRDVLTHLNLLKHDNPTHAAVLLFGKQPQKYLISSEIKCAHFHGTEAVKPIPSYQVYKGTVFDLVDQAVDFILSKINLAIGTRKYSVQVPVEYEMPQEVVREAVVNAVAHRDYTSNGSIQVMLFSDRLEIWNPGTLPPPLTLDKLRRPHGSVPGNPLLAESLYLTKYIERMGTGIRDMIKRCRNAGIPEPDFSLTDGFVTIIRRKPGRAFKAVGGEVTREVTREVTGEVTGEVQKLLMICRGSMTRKELQKALSLKGEENFRKLYLVPALGSAYIEMTIPNKPNSRLQKYRLTDNGQRLLKKLIKKK